MEYISYDVLANIIAYLYNENEDIDTVDDLIDSLMEMPTTKIALSIFE